MRTALSFILGAAFVSLAEVIHWTNTSGGNWNVPANWNPNQVPSTNDTALITNAGTYTVTLNVDPTVAGLLLGGSTGTQTLTLAGRALTLKGSMTVATNGLINFNGGSLAGSGHYHVAGTLNWVSGTVNVQTGRLTLTTPAEFQSGCAFTGAGQTWMNNGTNLMAGDLYSENLVLLYNATLVGTGVVNGTISWEGGTLGAEAAITLATNSHLNIGSAAQHTKVLNGSLKIQGDYEQTLGGITEFELAGNLPGTNHSRLNVTGAATLRGIVGVCWSDRFVPAPGTNFPVMTFASRQGEFNGYDHCILLGQGRRLVPVYSATSFSLDTVAAPEPESVPLHVVVDGGALVAWPVEFAGYELHWSTNLARTNWTLLPGVTNRWIETPPLAREKFFRLHRP